MAHPFKCPCGTSTESIECLKSADQKIENVPVNMKICIESFVFVGEKKIKRLTIFTISDLYCHLVVKTLGQEFATTRIHLC